MSTHSQDVKAVMWGHQGVVQACLPRLQQNFQALWLADEVKAATAATNLTESGYYMQVDGD